MHSPVSPSSVSPGHLNNFDLIRIFAAVQVMFFHGIGVLDIAIPKVLEFFKLFPGVPIFYAVSGYLVTQSYFRSRSIGEFAWKRALRIYPGLWLCISICILVMSIFHFDVFKLESIGWLAAQIAGFSFTPSYLRGFGVGSYNGSLWTIGIELQFYVCVPIVYFLVTRFRSNLAALLVLFAVFVVLGLVCRIYSPGIQQLVATSKYESLLQHSFVPYFFIFMTGSVLQRCNSAGLDIVRGKAPVWFLVYVAVCYAVPDNAFATVLKSILLAICTISAAHTAGWLSGKVLGKVDLSYGVYLYHALVLNILVQLHMVGSWLYLGVTFVAAFVLASFSWFLVESRALKMKRVAR